MLRRLESVFQDEKNFFEKKFFPKFLASLTVNIKATQRSVVLTKQQKVPRDIFIYNVEKFNLLA